MESFYTLPILILVAAVLIIALLMWFIGTRRSRLGVSDETRAQVSDARLDAGEHPSAVVSEQIEEMVRRSLAAYPDLADTKLDFGTAPDGSLDFWVNDQRYDNMEDIPDERLRAAVREAISRFNR